MTSSRRAQFFLLLFATCAYASSYPYDALIVRKLFEDAAADGGADRYLSAATCAEGTDDDATLAASPMAKQYGLTTCAQTYSLLMQHMKNSDLLCKTVGVGVCNCTCAGVEVEPSPIAEIVPLDESLEIGGSTDPLFNCADVRANEGAKNAILLPSYTREWHCHELGEVGVLLWDTGDGGKTISFAAEFASAGGGAAIGLSSNGGMFGADLLWVDKDDTDVWVVKDMFSRGYDVDGSLVSLDVSQDAKLEWSKEGDGHIAFVLSRPIQSCDQDHDLDIRSGNWPLIWARFSGHGHVYHGPGKDDRGTVYLNILREEDNFAGSIPEDPSDLFIIDFRMGNGSDHYEVPDSQVNTYACRSFQAPTDQPYHIIAHEPILDSVNTAASVVHHMVLWSCDADAAMPSPGECGTMEQNCQMFELVWTLGAPLEVLPAVAGLPLKKFLKLEVHYENLQLEGGIQDRSGLRLTITPKLREHDFGYMITGTALQRTRSLEPNEENVSRQGFCSSDCLAKYLPGSGVEVHNMIFHAHLLGRSLKTQHFRGDKELQNIGSRPFYDFNHQSGEPAHKGSRLMPGDALITTCVYDTRGRENETLFGVKTSEEMCLNFIGVYPLPKGFICVSSQDMGFCLGEDISVGGVMPASKEPYTEPTRDLCSKKADPAYSEPGSPDEMPWSNIISGCGQTYATTTSALLMISLILNIS
eukprot:CAMPEP_0183294602 /NCGR_PEP_ID=MMETSP0160_2-20130417/2876_1 /TAXON_ID=2839 ORGANISM="Odontella Sinensis, Strain Grunow 1884" /NCGR_SAMPLE_ID=MMETSP0160_2 /ASSEMBLY_ACC=CAM_ASM_000250 /LENGTH=697 /DNA_ID=CAMNT_0025455951 /DNA_START=50 /DNA_END=2143 /DNA_ORIENTATION=+